MTFSPMPIGGGAILSKNGWILSRASSPIQSELAADGPSLLLNVARRAEGCGACPPDPGAILHLQSDE